MYNDSYEISTRTYNIELIYVLTAVPSFNSVTAEVVVWLGAWVLISLRYFWRTISSRACIDIKSMFLYKYLNHGLDNVEMNSHSTNKKIICNILNLKHYMTQEMKQWLSTIHFVPNEITFQTRKRSNSFQSGYKENSLILLP